MRDDSFRGQEDAGQHRDLVGADMPNVPEDGAMAGRSPCDDGAQNGQETGIDCGGACPTLCPPCASVGTRLFVTSEAFYGPLSFVAADRMKEMKGGLESADYLCEESAKKAGLGGRWRAWLSSTQGRAKDRVKEVGPWHFIDRCAVVVDSLATLLERGPNTRLDRDETGALIPSPAYWTGTEEDGSSAGAGCLDWSSSDKTREAAYGHLAPGAPLKTWGHAGFASCNQAFSLLCFEQ